MPLAAGTLPERCASDEEHRKLAGVPEEVMDLDTLLTVLYVEMDGHVGSSGRRRPGQPKRLTDAELVYLITTQDGIPVAWCLADSKIGEREVAAALLAHAARTGALRPGLILIGDKGFAGREFEDLVTAEFALHLVRPDRRDEVPRHRSIRWIRQWIESVNDTPSRASSTSNVTAGAPPRGSTPASRSDCWPCPCVSGTTGSPAPRSGAR